MRFRGYAAAVALTAALAVAGCAEAGTGGEEGFTGGEGAEDCIILAMGGNKLCGEDARAWCDSTTELREGDEEFGIEPDYETQQVCDGL